MGNSASPDSKRQTKPSGVMSSPESTCCLTTELSGRPRRRLPHAEQANNLLATRVRPTIVHGPLQRVVRCPFHCTFAFRAASGSIEAGERTGTVNRTRLIEDFLFSLT